MDLNKFSRDILNKDIPLNTLKLIIFMHSSNSKEILIDDICEKMYITKKKLTNEFKKTKPIDGYLSIIEVETGFDFDIMGTVFQVLDVKNPKSKKKKELISKKDDAIQIIFEYWCSVMGKASRTILDNDRRKYISKGLENNTIDECKLAILGCSKNLWNMGKKDGNTKIYNSLELIFRNQTKIDDFILDAQLPSIEDQLIKMGKSNKIEDRLKDNDWFNQRAGMVSDALNNIQENNLIESEKDVKKILVENKKSTTSINIDGLVKASEAVFYKSLDNAFISNNILEGEIIPNETLSKKSINEEIIEAEIISENEEEIPYYLRISQSEGE